MPNLGDKKKFKGKKLNGLRYVESEYMGEDIGWVDSYRDVEGEKALAAYYKARADYEERDFKRKMGLWNFESKRFFS